jgi:iron complex transport system ATP-binding protein
MSLIADIPAVRRGGVEILAPLRLAVNAGQVLGVIGPNGAGKSTALRGLAGLDKACLQWCGAALYQSQIGYLPQHFHLDARLCVLEVVLLGKREGLGWRVALADLQAAEAVLTALNLAHLAARRIDSLSGGQQQMVLLAQRLLRAPRLMVLDEPTSALDLHHQLAILHHLQSYARQSQSVVVMALHDLTLAARFCDQLALLKQGRLLAIGKTCDVLTCATVSDCWQIKAEILHGADGSMVVVPHSTCD